MKGKLFSTRIILQLSVVMCVCYALSVSNPTGPWARCVSTVGHSPSRHASIFTRKLFVIYYCIRIRDFVRFIMTTRCDWIIVVCVLLVFVGYFLSVNFCTYVLYHNWQKTRYLKWEFDSVYEFEGQLITCRRNNKFLFTNEN